MKIFVPLFFLFSLSLSAQIKGVVIDSLSGKPIPYVNIVVENESIGSTSEEDGSFVVYTSEKSKRLLFSALGFEKKTVPVNETKTVQLKPIEYELQEVMISNRLQTKEIEIGKTNSAISQAFDYGPRIDTKFFPYLPQYKKTKFIKQVSIVTDNKIEDALIKIHLYEVNDDGFPGKELIEKELFVTIQKGTRTHKIDVSKYNLVIPKKGIFIGFEKLLIERNKLEKTITDSNTKTTKVVRTYYPYVLYNYIERPFLFTFVGGKWKKETNFNEEEIIEYKRMYEPSINLILTN
jgi:hypothetical protein